MSEMIKRVGEALRKACREEYGTDWNNEVAWKFAIAAIEAMREPTKSMKTAASKAMSPRRRPEEWVSNNVKHTIRYQAMIDDALELHDLRVNGNEPRTPSL